ncbi:CBS domain-containing protein [Phaeodactylibacter sp.]|jgi:CBS domain-containing protein|uniref:CBS domain-containing protein n=1 Tax=Phaeodactylibacter sp. TaxID=1940289 RepID=UPI0025FB84FA|nr:CBS domain-containing protein [Phaeodactylibacter sp.]MCI4648742.1 CBS domain-containing protein [Phaeodactylibacter sp.]MCI5090292.1 CBS domain-containing protein [Phaeodactylibacter sp.]
MTAQQLISDSIIPLRTSETGDTALGIMNDFYVRHLPIVNDKQLLGLISEEDILEHDAHEPVGSYQLSLIRPYVKHNDHLYEILRLIAEYHLTLIPVVDEEENYIGLITMEDVLQYFTKTASFSEPGSIVVLEMSRHDYQLSQIAQIVESENAAVLSAFITTSLDSIRVDVTIKINRQNIQNILATFERYEYEVKASFNEIEYLDSLRDRYDSLMAYLNV